MSIEMLLLFLFVVMCIVYTFGLGTEPKPKPKPVIVAPLVAAPTTVPDVVGGLPAGRIMRPAIFGGAETAADRELANLNSSIEGELDSMHAEESDDARDHKEDTSRDHNDVVEDLRVPDATTASTILARDNDPELVAHYSELRDKLTAINPANKQKTIIGYHYADWCKYCTEFKPTWQAIERTVAKNPRFANVKLTLVDYDVHKLRSLKTIPAIIKSTPDGAVVRYNGPRTARRILRWCMD